MIVTFLPYVDLRSLNSFFAFVADFAGKEISAETLMTLLAAGHEMQAVARVEGDNKGVSFDQFSKMCVIGFQSTDSEEALAAVLDRHIKKLGGTAPAEPAAEPAAEPGAQV